MPKKPYHGNPQQPFLDELGKIIDEYHIRSFLWLTTVHGAEVIVHVPEDVTDDPGGSAAAAAPPEEAPGYRNAMHKANDPS